MKTLSIVLAISFAAMTSNAAPKCTVVANQRLNQALRLFDLPATAKVQLMAPKKIKNSYGDHILVYEASSIEIEEGSHIPDGTASIVLLAADCSALKVKVDVFSGTEF